MSTLLTIGGITKKSMFVLKNTCDFLPLITSDYSDQFAVVGAKIGYTINIRKPPRYEVTRGQQAVLQGTNETYVTLALSNQLNIALPFSMADRTLSLDNYTERVIVPKTAAIANAVDVDVAAIAQKFAWSRGTPGTAMNTMLAINEAGALLTNLGFPRVQRSVVLTPDMHATMAAAQTGIFNPANAISETYRTGQITKYANFAFHEDPNLPTHTAGIQGGTPLVNGTTAAGATTLVTDGWTSGTAVTRLNVGDTFTVAGVYAVNPQSRVSFKKLRPFTVMAPGVETSGAMTITFSPAMIPAGQNQNIDALPADNAAITVTSGASATTYCYGVAMSKGAIGIGFADIELPPAKGVVESFRQVDEDTGLSMATVTAYDVYGGQTITRTDIIYGVCQIYEDGLIRLWDI